MTSWVGLPLRSGTNVIEICMPTLARRRAALFRSIGGGAMTEDSFDTEHEALLADHEALLTEHRYCIEHPADRDAHRAHLEHLREHLERLGRHRERLHD